MNFQFICNSLSVFLHLAGPKSIHDMKKLVITIFLSSILVYSNLYGQLSLDNLLESFDNLNEEFPEYLQENHFEKISHNTKLMAEKWALLDREADSKPGLTIDIKRKPYKSIWIESLNHPVYVKLENEIIKRCEFRGFFGCSEVETWNSYWHSSGIEFRLIEKPESIETGLRIIEVIEN